MNIECLNKIYNALGDEISREIFTNRLMLLISNGDFKYLRNIILTNSKIRMFVNELKEKSKSNGLVIFGAGENGKRLFKLLEGIPIRYFVDNNAKKMKSTIGDVSIISYEDFVKKYQGEYIIISSTIYREEIIEQLNKDEFKNIIDYGEIRLTLSNEQYFDLEYLHPAETKEVFVDAGCCDGKSSNNFVRWCNSDSFIYAFEPDARRIEECRNNFEKNSINYKLIDKGLWKEKNTVPFMYANKGECYIGEGNGTETVEVTSLDTELEGKEVTFIKMDIEGAELEALIGAESLIKKNRPKLAISIYHKMEDIIEIPQIILEYYPDYRLYLRHYSIITTETILYAIPT